MDNEEWLCAFIFIMFARAITLLIISINRGSTWNLQKKKKKTVILEDLIMNVYF